MSSEPTTVTFSAPLSEQAALRLTITISLFGLTLTRTTSGGSGTGALTYTATDGTATGCQITGTSLSSATVGTCTVVATKADDDVYLPVASPPTTVTVLYATNGFQGPVGKPIRPGSAIKMKFTLTDGAGQPISDSLAAGLDAAGAMKLQLSGPGTGDRVLVTKPCPWHRSPSSARSPRRRLCREDRTPRYYVTMSEDVGTGWWPSRRSAPGRTRRTFPPGSRRSQPPIWSQTRPGAP
ncbi:MAG: Ig-like domain-containing protein [Actinomycetes bacterium]